jgi:hypothetical protein
MAWMGASFGSGSGAGDSPPNPNYPDLRIWSNSLRDGETTLAEGATLSPRVTYTVVVIPVSEEHDARNGCPDDIANIETDVFTQSGGDPWTFLCRVYTRPETLTDGKHEEEESCVLTIADAMAGKPLGIRATVDATGECHEQTEDNNTSDADMYWVDILPYQPQRPEFILLVQHLIAQWQKEYAASHPQPLTGEQRRLIQLLIARDRKARGFTP